MMMKGGGLGYAEAAFETQQLQQLFGIIRCPLEYHQYTQPWFIKYNQVSLRSGVPTIKLPFEYHLYTQLWYYQVSLRVDQVSPSTLNFQSQRTVVVSLCVPLSTIGTLNFESQSTVVIHYMLCLYVSQEYHWYTQL